jgi:hypothetical protein
MQCASCSFSGKPLTPIRSRQSPQYLYARRYWQVIPWDVQPYTTNEFARFLDLGSPYPPPALRDEVFAVIRHGVAFLTRQWCWEMRHNNGSALSAANGSRSDARHCLRNSRCVSNSIGAFTAYLKIGAAFLALTADPEWGPSWDVPATALTGILSSVPPAVNGS